MPSCTKRATPFANCVLVNPEPLGNLLALQTLRAQQDYPATIRQRTRGLVAAHLTLEKTPLLAAQFDQIRLSARHRLD